MSISALLGGGTTGALVAAAILVAKVVQGYLQERRKTQVDESDKESARVKDHATENAVLVSTVDALHKENDRLTKRLTAQDQQIKELQTEIAELQKRLTRISSELAQLQDKGGLS